jgi:drug/metabolite transporter (DMT)-like permease
MNNFLPVAIFAYALNGGSILVDKILLNRNLPSPFVYAFYISVLGNLAFLLIPFGVVLDPIAMLLAFLSGVFFVFGLLTFYQSLKTGEASIVAPIVGSLNPLFSLLIEWFFLNQIISKNHLGAVLILIVGTVVLTFNMLRQNVKFNQQLWLMVISALWMAMSYVLLAQSFNLSNFMTGLVFRSLGSGIIVLTFLFFKSIRSQIFGTQIHHNRFANSTTGLLFAGQTMGAISGILITFSISLSNPAVVNSLFGVQYLVILITAIILSRKHPELLDEKLNASVLTQKIIGCLIISYGVYLLSQ